MERAQRALLLEVERPAGRRRDAAEAAAQVRDGGAHRRLGQHPQAERQRRRADVVAPLQVQRGGDGLQVRLAELPVRQGGAGRRSALPRPAGSRGGVPPGVAAHPGQQPQVLAVPEHPGGRAEPPRGRRDPHGHDLNNFTSRKPGSGCGRRPRAP